MGLFSRLQDPKSGQIINRSAFPLELSPLYISGIQFLQNFNENNLAHQLMNTFSSDKKRET